MSAGATTRSAGDGTTDRAPTDAPPIYGAILGAEWVRVPEPLRSFHASATGGVAAGTLAVRGSASRIGRAVAAALGMPRATPAAAVVLSVTIHGDRQRWERRFDGRPLVSWQRAHRGLLLERFGPYTFGFDLVVEPDGLSYRFRRAWLFGIPVPRWLAVRSRARAWADGAGWRVESVVTAPLVGLLAEYTGTVTPA